MGSQRRTASGAWETALQPSSQVAKLASRVSPEGVKERVDWVTPYDGAALVVYGHTPVWRAERCGQTIDIDTGCVFGGRLTALRYPEMEVVEVPAERAYSTTQQWQLLRARMTGMEETA